MFKKICAVMISVLLAITTCITGITAIAADRSNGNGTVTVTNARDGETYSFYKIMDVDYTAGDADNNDEGAIYRYFISDGWNDFFKEVLNDDSEDWETRWNGYTQTQKNNLAHKYIADLDPQDDPNAEELSTFATQVKQYADKNNIAPNATLDGDAASTDKTAKDRTLATTIPYGYYVMAPVDSTTGKVLDTASLFSVDNVIPKVSIENKSFYPTLTKEVKSDNSDFATSNSAAIDDTISYRLTSAFPDARGYDEYSYVITDTYSKGITPDMSSLTVKIGDTTLTAEDDYTVEQDTDAMTITLTFDIKALAVDYNRGDALVVNYDAKVNKDAVIGTEGNLNKADLEFSNNPADTESTDKTPETYTKTFVGGFSMTKKDTAGQTLDNATFKLTGDNLNHVNITGDALRNDGTKTEDVDAKDGISFTTTSTGLVTIDGLEDGTYTLTETEAPEGFETLENPIIITINSGLPVITSADTKATYADTKTESDDVSVSLLNDTTKNLEFTVVNQPSSPLPKTGAMGLVGLGIAAVAAIGGGLALGKKKKNDDENED